MFLSCASKKKSKGDVIVFKIYNYENHSIQNVVYQPKRHVYELIKVGEHLSIPEEKVDLYPFINQDKHTHNPYMLLTPTGLLADNKQLVYTGHRIRFIQTVKNSVLTLAEMSDDSLALRSVKQSEYTGTILNGEVNRVLLTDEENGESDAIDLEFIDEFDGPISIEILGFDIQRLLDSVGMAI